MWPLVLIVLNALFGVILFEWAWKKTANFRTPIKELDELLPAYRRVDAVKWRKIDFYFGAMTIMIPRIVILFVIIGTLTLIIKVVLIGQPNDG